MHRNNIIPAKSCRSIHKKLTEYPQKVDRRISPQNGKKLTKKTEKDKKVKFPAGFCCSFVTFLPEFRKGASNHPNVRSS
jgi:hypothetical protein